MGDMSEANGKLKELLEHSARASFLFARAHSSVCLRMERSDMSNGSEWLTDTKKKREG
jgi:hypothetical protein